MNLSAKSHLRLYYCHQCLCVFFCAKKLLFGWCLVCKPGSPKAMWRKVQKTAHRHSLWHLSGKCLPLLCLHPPSPQHKVQQKDQEHFATNDRLRFFATMVSLTGRWVTRVTLRGSFMFYKFCTVIAQKVHS